MHEFFSKNHNFFSTTVFDKMLLGLKWHVVSTTLCKGREIKNDELTHALMQKQEFTNDELVAFEVQDVHFDDYVKVGSDYFQPVVDVIQPPDEVMSEETRLKRKKLRKRPQMLELARKYDLLTDTE